MILNKFLLTFTLLSAGVISAQVSPDNFDFKAAYAEAAQRQIPASDVEGFVNAMHYEYLNGQGHSHNGGSVNNGVYNAGTIHLNGNQAAGRPAPGGPGQNTPQNQYCPNAGFEQFNFANWTGGYGTVATGSSGAGSPTYNQTSGTIANGGGANVGLTNTANYHTIMTTPPTNNVHPNLVGWDSIASRVVGTQTVSEIPVVNPNGGPASVRLNGAVANYRASKLSYVMALNPNNKNFSVSYAIVLNTYSTPHNPWEQPYFSVRVTDQNGNMVPGCSTYSVTIHPDMANPSSPMYDPTWTESFRTAGVTSGDKTYYRKWQTFAFDFSNYPSITSVTVEFYVGGCSQSGHYGYAYVDAQCSQGGALASYCAGSNISILNAPAGYSTYQWTGPSGPVSPANGGNTATVTITPALAGQVYTCAVTAPNGCSSIFTTTITTTTVSINGMGSTPSCPSGASGTAYVSAIGSSLGYTYQWFDSGGSSVGNSATATGLPPGTYSVTVSSPSCGSATSTVSVGTAPPTFYTQTANYCGTTGWIIKNGGTNYKWYSLNPTAVISSATTPTLTISNPVNGSQYALVYTNASGCKDSVKYTMAQIPGGSIYVSNIKSICAGNSNAYAVVNLLTSAPPAYSYTVTGPGGYSSILSNTSLVKDSVTGLSIGTYTTAVFDGQCMYNATFTVNPFVYTYTLTPTTATICTTGGTPLSVNFGNTAPTVCGLSASGGCTSPANTQIGTGSVVNTNTGWPCIFGNYYKNNRHQLLYTAAELNAAGITPGKLSSIAFQVNSMNPLMTPSSSNSSIYSNVPFNFTIKIKCTTVTSLNSTFDNTGLVQVYNGNYSATTGWNTLNFNQAYEWPGGTNILIDICYNMQAYYTSNPIMPGTNTGVAMCRYAYSDSYVTCNTTNAATTSTTRPNIRIGNCTVSNPALFTYSWTPATGLSSTNTYSTYAAPPATTVYTVEVNPIGQTNCMQAQTATVSIINPITPTITPVGPLCTNAAPVSFTASPAGGVWAGQGISTTGVMTPAAAAVGNNTYTYTVGSGTCSAVGSTSVSVEQFVPSTITSSLNPQCITNPALPLPLTASPTGTWTGTGISGTNFDPALAGVGTHTLTYSTQSSPTATLCPSSSSVTVDVGTITQPTITPAGPFCDNFPVQTMTVSQPGGVWGSSTTGTSNSASGSFSPASSIVGANVITYTLTNGPCTAVATETVIVTHYVDPTISGAGPYCLYDPVLDLQTLATNQGGSWTGTGVSGTNFDPSVAGAGTHVLTYSTNPVPYIANLCSDSRTISIQVNPTPIVVLNTANPAGCNYPFVTSFYPSNVNTGTLVWTFGDNSAPVTGFAPTHAYTTPGSYTVTTTYTDNAGCTSTSTLSSAITVYQVPVADFNPTPDVTTVVDGEVTFNNQTSDLSHNTYYWSFAGLGNSSDVSPVYLFTNSGEYFVTLIATSPYGCQDTAVKKVTVNPDVVLYVPNAFTPNGDGLNDEFQIFLPPTGVDYSSFQLTIYNRWGEVIYKSNDVYKFWNGARNNSGEIVKQDTYVYKITFKDDKNKYFEKIGYVSLLKQ